MSVVTKAKQKYKHFPRKSSGSNRKFFLEPNMKGFLCSCNNREKDCIRESYNILNQYLDKSAPAEPEVDFEEDDDINRALDQEISNLKKGKKFQAIDSGARNMIFIKASIDDPVELASKIVQDIFDNKSQQTRFLLRLVPVEVTCKAFIEDIIKAFTPLAEKHFKDSARSFGVIYNHRNNNSLNRDEVIKAIAAKVSEFRDDHKVDLKGAEVSVVVEIIKGYAFLSIIPNYLKYKKYNLLSAAAEEQGNKETASVESDP